MTSRKRIISLILASMMLLSAASCSESGTNDETTAQTAGENTEAAAPETIPEETGPVAELPDKTYDGEEVMFLTSLNLGYDWYTSYEIYAEEMNGQLINDAVFQRNTVVEDLLDIKIAETKESGCHTIAKNSISAGDKQFDVVMPYMNSTITLAVEGALLDLNQIPYLALEKPWWDGRANKDLIINDRLYITTGDISILDNECTMVMFFNKEMISQNNLESPYEFVREKRWTIDKVAEMSQNLTRDKNGDGNMTTADDQWGISIANNAPISFYFGAGERVVKADDNGELQIMMGSNRAIDVFDKIANLCCSTEVLSIHTTDTANFDDVAASFNLGNILFVTFALVDINSLREAEFEFGILPYPLYDENQEEYNNLISTGLVSSTSVPNTCDNTELVGVTLEAMAYESTKTLTPAYYDNALKSRYVRDEESRDMLDIIFATRVYDLGFIYDWGGAGSMITNMFIGNQTGYASQWKRIEKVVTKAMERSLEKFAEIPQ